MDKIFLVDDEEIIYNIVEKLFEDQDYKIAYSKTGKDALKKLRKRKLMLLYCWTLNCLIQMVSRCSRIFGKRM